MKKRSQITAISTKTKAAPKPSTEAPKPSAEERTLPLPVEGERTCTVCDTTTPLAKATVRRDGSYECPECGAPLPLKDAPKAKASPEPAPEPKAVPGASSSPQSGTTSKAPQIGDDDSKKPQMYCDQCGAAWPRVNGRPFPNCGHTEGMVDDPMKAKKPGPPAGHPILRVVQGEDDVAKRATASAERAIATAQATRTTPIVDSDAEMIPMIHLHVAWGEKKFPTDVRFANFAIGPFNASIDLPVTEDLRARARELHAALQAIASEAFEAERKWFEAALDKLDASYKAKAKEDE